MDIVVALIEYLRSGTSRVGYLNNSVTKNMLHKDQEDVECTEEGLKPTENLLPHQANEDLDREIHPRPRRSTRKRPPEEARGRENVKRRR